MVGSIPHIFINHLRKKQQIITPKFAAPKREGGQGLLLNVSVFGGKEI